MRSLIVCLSLVAACGSSPAVQTAGPIADAAPATVLLPFASEASAERLARSRHRQDFFVLANHYEGQEHGGMCGPATMVIVLNALRTSGRGVDALPVDRSAIPETYRAQIPPRYDPFFHRYTQRAFFEDARAAGVKSEATFYGTPPAPGAKPDPGFQLRQVHDVLVAMGVDATLRVLDDHVSDADARREIIDNLGRADDYVIVNYTRQVLGQEGGGHLSPVGAYDDVSDSFLVLDVNPNRGKTWAWVPASMLLTAMRTFDTIENRGYLLVRDAPAN